MLFRSPLRGLADSIAAIAEHTRKEFNLTVECATTGRALPVQGPIARELLMVVREAVYNAALHGHPSRIAITLAYHRGQIVITIADDGTGFDPQAASTRDGKQHYGIAGMRERMERIHGHLELKSSEGKGTTVQAQIGRHHLMAAPAKTAMEL